MENIFKGLFDTQGTTVISVENFLLCLGVSLLLGIVLAAVYMWKNTFTKSFLLTLGLLPAVVCVVIMMVNGNVGAGVAVAGAFSLVRFRSAPGSAKEIATIFLAMGAGLICGMGYLGYGALFTLIMCIAFLLFSFVTEKVQNGEEKHKTLKITIPEDLDYTGVFDDIFSLYTQKWELIQVKSTNMGSMFRLTYEITLKDPAREKEMLDMIRQRNGNLEIMVSRQETPIAQL